MGFDFDPVTWVTAIELPVAGGLFWMLHGLRQQLAERIETGERRDGAEIGRLRDELAAFKLDVARGYVAMEVARDMERRLALSVERIEEKLDAICASCRAGRS